MLCGSAPPPHTLTLSQNQCCGPSRGANPAGSPALRWLPCVPWHWVIHPWANRGTNRGTRRRRGPARAPRLPVPRPAPVAGGPPCAVPAAPARCSQRCCCLHGARGVQRASCGAGGQGAAPGTCTCRCPRATNVLWLHLLSNWFCVSGCGHACPPSPCVGRGLPHPPHPFPPPPHSFTPLSAQLNPRVGTAFAPVSAQL